MVEKTIAERYHIAKSLDSILHTVVLANDEQVEAIFDACELISPEFVAEQTAELDAALNSAEIQAEVEALARTPQAQAFIDAIEKYKRGEITLDELRDKWRNNRVLE